MLEDLPVELGLSFETLTYGIVFGKLSRLKILMRRAHLTIMDATHKTNRLY